MSVEQSKNADSGRVGRVRRAWIAVAALAVAAVLTAVIIPIAAEAATVALTGTVTNSANAKLAGVAVTVYQDNSGVGPSAGSTTTSSTGTFSFASLAPGTYTLYFGASGSTYPQYLGETTDVLEAQTLTLVVGGGNHSYVNAVLANSGTIAGSVKTSTGAALKGYTVRAYPDGGDESTPVKSTTTSATGAYSLAGLVPGSYRLEAIDTAAGAPYAPAFSGGGTSIANATGVGAVAGVTTAYSFSLGRAGSISGKVTGQTMSGTEALSGVKVIPYQLEGTSPSFYDYTSVGLTPVTTNSAGAYTLTGLAPGYYTLDFVPGTTPIGASHTVYGRTFLGGAEIWSSATIVHVGSGTSSPNQNIELQPGGSVTLTIYDYDDYTADPQVLTPLPNILVTVDHPGADVDQPSDQNESAITDANGQVTFTGLAGGTWESIIGSNTTAGGTEDDSYQREVSDFPVSAGGTLAVTATLPKKPAGGLQATTAPVISGGSATPTVGDNLQVSFGVWNSFVSSTTFQWLRNGVPIVGATTESYIVQGGDVGANLSVAVTANSFAYGSATVDTASVGPEQPGSLASYGYPPYIIGQDAVGETLTITHNPWTIGSVQFAYQWQTSPNGTTWTNISGETGPTHQITAADLTNGPEVRATWTASREGYSTSSGATSADTVIKNSFTATTAPRLVSTASTFTVVDGVWDPNIGATTATWTIEQANGAITHQTGLTLSRAGLAGDYVTVALTRDAAGVFENASYQFTAQTGTLVASPAGTISGTAQVGRILTATLPTYAPSATGTYQWQHEVGTAWKNITAATSSQYTVQSTDLGDAVRVQFTGTLGGYSTLVTNSTATAKITLAPAPTNTLAPTVSGSPGTNLSVTAATGNWSPTPASFKYQWKDASSSSGPFSNIAGATGSSYKIPTALAGKYLTFTETTVLPGFASSTATASPVLVGTDYMALVANPTVTRSGSTLTASGAKFAPAATTTTYYWYAYDANDSTYNYVSMGTTFQVTPTYANSHLVVIAVGQTAPFAATDTAFVLAQKATMSTTGTLAITGSAVGTSLSLSGLSYQPNLSFAVTHLWQYLSGSTWKNIPGATGATYVPTPTYFGLQVRAEQMATLPDFNTNTTASTPVTVTAGVAPAPGSGSSDASISGSDTVGSTLTANPGVWNIPGTTFKYQWQVSSDDSTFTNISGATGKTYVIPPGDFATKWVGVTITGTTPGHTPGTVFRQESNFAGLGATVATTVPKVTKSASGTYSVTTGAWKPAPQGISFAWRAYDASTDTWNLVGPASNAYAPDSSLAGDPIEVEVDVVGASGYDDAQWTSVVRTGSAITPTASSLSVTGINVVGQSMYANWSTFSVQSPTVSVQWYRGTTAIPGATSSTYQAATADIGKAVTAKITVAKLGYTSATFTVGSMTVLSNVSLDPQNQVITGTDRVDDPLSVAGMVFPVSGTTVKYQWYRNYEIIPGATGPTYTPGVGDIGQEFTVEYWVSKTNYQSDYSYIPEVIVLQGAPLANKSATPVVISGNPAWGSTLTGVVGAWNYPATVTYQWQYEVPGGSTWTTVVGAGSSTYVPSATDGLMPGSTIRLTVTASRPGHASDTEVSPYFYMQP